jgi:uncharacterized protein (TIGR03067 family)
MSAGIPFLVALVAPLLPTGPGPAELQGPWKFVAVEGNGRTLTVAREPRWVIVGDTVLYGGRPLARLTADPKASPKLIDLKVRPDRVFEGVYAVEKDALKVCVNKDTGSVKNRPGAFATEGQADWRLMVFERVKPADGVATEAGFLGVQLRMDKDRGVVVDAALDRSPARAAGLKRDDVIVRVGGRDVADLQAAADAVRAVGPGAKLEVRVRRDGKEIDLTVRVGLLPFEVLAELD